MRNNVLLSIVTIAYNACNDGLESTISSVLSQKSNLVEYLVVDGGSKDNSQSVYDKYRSNFDFFVSEKDRGISDAFNKGIRNSTGRYIWFLNAGDRLADGAVNAVVDFIESKNPDIIFGDMIWVDDAEVLLKPSSDYQSKIEFVMPFLHPSTLMKKQIFDVVGYFDLRLKRAMDYDVALRAHLAGFKAEKLDVTLSYMSAGGVHDEDYWKTLKEVYKVSYFSGSNPFKAALAMLYTYLSKKSRVFIAVKGLLK